MSLPADGTDWPPTDYAAALRQVEKDSAWLTGDLPAIRNQLRGDQPKAYQSPAQFNGGVVGAVARTVLGRPAQSGGVAAIDRHLPVAADLVATAANHLAGDPVKFTLHEDDREVITTDDAGNETIIPGNTKAAQALADLTSPDVFAAELLGAAMKIGGHGFHYARIVWNFSVSPDPWIEWVDGDQAYAEYANGRQVAVTFWDTYVEKNTVYRLLQRHTPGYIEYGLYEGTTAKLGRRVPVTDHPKTANLAELINEDSVMATGIDKITARQFINLERNVEWRKDPQLRYYGVSDVGRGGDIWADIDLAWTEMLHEMTSARHRLMVSADLLTTGQPGSGSSFEIMRDVFPLSTGGDVDGKPLIQSVQPEMRIDKYMLVVEAASRKAIDAVGQSPIAVGMDPQAGGEMTATETRTRWAKTLQTFKGKSRNFRAGLSELLTAYLHLHAAINKYAPPTKPVDVSIVEPVQETDLDKARTLGELRSHNLASIHHGVTTLHPEWTPAQIDAEVERIIAEMQGSAPADPFDVGEDMSPDPVADADGIAKRVTAATALIRSGYKPDAALDAVGLDPIEHTGLLPVTLRNED